MSDGRRARNKREVRQRIRKAASRLLAEHGVGVRIEDIAAAADVSRATFFNYYATKNVLLDELSARINQRLDEGLRHVRAETTDLRSALEAWLMLVAESLEAREALNRALFAHSFFGAGTSLEGRRAQQEHLHGAYADLLREAQERGELAPEADLTFLAEQLAGAVFALVNGWLNAPDYPVRERARQTARFLYHGMLDSSPSLD